MTGISELWEWGGVEAETDRLIFTSQLTVVIGATDTGKSTFLAKCASALSRAGRRCAVVDSDIGQSDVGPPSTTAMGVVKGPISTLSEVRPSAMHFVGSFSPKGKTLECLAGVKIMVQRAREAAVDHILIDTTGFLEGKLARALKLNKIQLLDPDLVVCLERKGECRFIQGAFRNRSRPRVISLPPVPGARIRSPAERTQHRILSLKTYLRGSTLKHIKLSEIATFDWPLFHGEILSVKRLRSRAQGMGCRLLWGEIQGDHLVIVAQHTPEWRWEERIKEDWDPRRVEVLTPEDLSLRLLGVDDRSGVTRNIAVLERLEWKEQTAVIWSLMNPDDIGGLRFGAAYLTQAQWDEVRPGPALGKESRPISLPEAWT